MCNGSPMRVSKKKKTRYKTKVTPEIISCTSEQRYNVNIEHYR